MFEPCITRETCYIRALYYKRNMLCESLVLQEKHVILESCITRETCYVRALYYKRNMLCKSLVLQEKHVM